jgi:hypothetical protein
MIDYSAFTDEMLKIAANNDRRSNMLAGAAIGGATSGAAGYGIGQLSGRAQASRFKDTTRSLAKGLGMNADNAQWRSKGLTGKVTSHGAGKAGYKGLKRAMGNKTGLILGGLTGLVGAASGALRSSS